MEDRKIRVAITHGDTNGIGYELIFKTFAEPEMLELCTPIIYGSPKIAAYHRKAMDTQANFSIINKAEDAQDGRVNLLACFDDDVKVDLGIPTKESGEAALKALDRAMTDFRSQLFDVLVACPVNPDNMSDANFTYRGLKQYSETSIGDGAKAIKMLINESMRIALATDGLAIKDVPSHITEDLLLAKLRTINEAMKRDFRLSNPRIGVLALNSTANGDEEKKHHRSGCMQGCRRRHQCLRTLCCRRIFWREYIRCLRCYTGNVRRSGRYSIYNAYAERRHLLCCLAASCLYSTCTDSRFRRCRTGYKRRECFASCHIRGY